ncbi:GNAT family N-acetyltransferase [Derxia gummosa]|uniref:GNAT family N-acetyltransferase n=1 Tax=Derxia gummosa DSM 723 TaxID=1121388 RepID=A0A8B6XDA2_9BURK|nr:GNAT family N-acetyltransferase [Derxia gummosa]
MDDVHEVSAGGVVRDASIAASIATGQVMTAAASGPAQRLPRAEVTVRRAVPADAPAFATTMATPRAQAMTLQMPLLDVELWREKLTKAPPGWTVLAAEVEGEVVGNLSLFPADPWTRRRAHAYAFGMAVRDDMQGRGVGSALLGKALELADNWLGALRVELGVYADNAPAIALYEKHGFVVEGRMRAYALRGGEYADSLAMARLHPRPPRLPGALAQ